MRDRGRRQRSRRGDAGRQNLAHEGRSWERWEREHGEEYGRRAKLMLEKAEELGAKTATLAMLEVGLLQQGFSQEHALFEPLPRGTSRKGLREERGGKEILPAEQAPYRIFVEDPPESDGGGGGYKSLVSGQFGSDWMQAVRLVRFAINPPTDGTPGIYEAMDAEDDRKRRQFEEWCAAYQVKIDPLLAVIKALRERPEFSDPDAVVRDLEAVDNDTLSRVLLAGYGEDGIYFNNNNVMVHITGDPDANSAEAQRILAENEAAYDGGRSVPVMTPSRHSAAFEGLLHSPRFSIVTSKEPPRNLTIDHQSTPVIFAHGIHPLSLGVIQEHLGEEVFVQKDNRHYQHTFDNETGLFKRSRSTYVRGFDRDGFDQAVAAEKVDVGELNEEDRGKLLELLLEGTLGNSDAGKALKRIHEENRELVQALSRGSADTFIRNQGHLYARSRGAIKLDRPSPLRSMYKELVEDESVNSVNDIYERKEEVMLDIETFADREVLERLEHVYPQSFEFDGNTFPITYTYGSQRYHKADLPHGPGEQEMEDPDDPGITYGDILKIAVHVDLPSDTSYAEASASFLRMTQDDLPTFDPDQNDELVTVALDGPPYHGKIFRGLEAAQREVASGRIAQAWQTSEAREKEVVLAPVPGEALPSPEAVLGEPVEPYLHLPNGAPVFPYPAIVHDRQVFFEYDRELDRPQKVPGSAADRFTVKFFQNKEDAARAQRAAEDIWQQRNEFLAMRKESAEDRERSQQRLVRVQEKVLKILGDPFAYGYLPPDYVGHRRGTSRPDVASLEERVGSIIIGLEQGPDVTEVDKTLEALEKEIDKQDRAAATFRVVRNTYTNFVEALTSNARLETLPGESKIHVFHDVIQLQGRLYSASTEDELEAVRERLKEIKSQLDAWGN